MPRGLAVLVAILMAMPVLVTMFAAILMAVPVVVTILMAMPRTMLVAKAGRLIHGIYPAR
jgi:hypothetical protein